MASAILFPLNDRKVYLAGHRDMVGSALMRRHRREGCAMIMAVHPGRD